MIYNKHCIWIGRSFKEYGEFSEFEVILFRDILQAGDCAIDVGANIGSHTVPMAQIVGPSGTILAFEPNRLNYQVLCGNIALNQLENVHAYHGGLAASRGTIDVPMWDPRSPNNSGGIACDGSVHSDVIETVDAWTLDDFQIDAKLIRFIKIDVEGMERDVLLGARKTIEVHRPIMLVENDRESKSEALVKLLHELKYRTYHHKTALYNPDNFKKNPVNVFGGVGSFNLLCVPIEMAASLEGFEEV